MSRSNRVRKRSTKLADYESSEDIDILTKNIPSPTKKSQKTKVTKIQPIESDSSNSIDSESDLDVKDDMMRFSDAHWNENVDPNDLLDEDDDDDFDYDDDDDEDQPLQVDDSRMKDDGSYASQANSLYFSEKKKGSSKDINSVKRKKSERKDKGKARFTAYMLWARAMRPKIVQENPMMDFSSINKRLGEMWSLVPYTQKHNWKRKAKKLEAKEIKEDTNKPITAMISTGKQPKNQRNAPTLPGAKSNLIKKGKIQEALLTTTKLPKRGRGRPMLVPPEAIPPTIDTGNKGQSYLTPKSSKLSGLMMDISPPSMFKVTGTSPIDVAAHLKLLGESLNNIGQKLKEHEGQIAVSGSLSVLLDSMLCVLGPLACLSNQLEETQDAIPEQTMSNILDNIAYIMPGIV